VNAAIRRVAPGREASCVHHPRQDQGRKAQDDENVGNTEMNEDEQARVNRDGRIIARKPIRPVRITKAGVKQGPK